MKRHLVYNGQIIPEEEILVSPLNRGMMYGDGCFDTIRSYAGKFLRLEEHFNRLLKACDYLRIDIRFGFKGFKFKILELLDMDNVLEEQAIVRIQCWRDGGRGYSLDSSEAHWITSHSPLGSIQEAIRLATVQTRAIPSKALYRAVKLSNGLNYIQAAKAAKNYGADDGLMLNIRDKVSETTTSNIFWVKRDKIFTPSEKCDILPGITRQLAINIISEWKDYSLVEGEFDLSEIKKGEAVFCTNSIREIQAIEYLDDIRFQVSHPVIVQLRVDFQKYKKYSFLK